MQVTLTAHRESTTPGPATAQVPAAVQAGRLHEKLRREMGELTPFLLDGNVIEIMLNPDGQVWVERLGESMQAVGTMGASQAESLMATVASSLRVTIHRDNPILECELPIDGSRFEALLPPVVSSPTFTIRRKASRVFTLADYVNAGILDERQRRAIAGAAEARRNILIVGGTGSGKTTLANAVIEHIATMTPNDRLVIIEDTPEIQCRARNTVMLRTTAAVDMLRLLKATMRLRPDRILVGEVRGAEALSLLKAWNTGHPGGVCTIHANGARAGLTRLQSLVAEATPAPSASLIAAAVDLIVVIVKTPNGRRVSEVLAIDGHDGTDYLTHEEGND